MTYVLMTGGTGLLGEYLLRDLAVRDQPLVLIARASREGTALQRVEQLYHRWELAEGRALPRPVVLDGDLTKRDLGVTATDRRWLAQNCDRWLHNAASLTFEPQRPDGEPWVSNLGGTERSIELCRRLGIRSIHHVSTAYVAGLRQGTIREQETDVGQEFANEYEASKCASELAWRSAGFDQVTVYRPAIIVGDSVTGYTSTYHGFYAPLKSLHALLGSWLKRTIDQGAANDPRLSIDGLLSVLGLVGQETKNFVPVEWVSQAIVQILSSPAYHGLTYHLTPRNKVTARQVAEAMQASLVDSFRRGRDGGRAVERGADRAVEPPPALAVSRTFAEQVSVYREYWRDDPDFDTSNLQAALPHLPCPLLDQNVLKTLCDYAIAQGFGWPKKPWASLPAAVATELTGQGWVCEAEEVQPAVAVNLVGAGGARLVLGRRRDGSLGFSLGRDAAMYEWTMPASQWRAAGSFASVIQQGWASLSTPTDHTPAKLQLAMEFISSAEINHDSLRTELVK